MRQSPLVALYTYGTRYITKAEKSHMQGYIRINGTHEGGVVNTLPRGSTVDPHISKPEL